MTALIRTHSVILCYWFQGIQIDLVYGTNGSTNSLLVKIDKTVSCPEKGICVNKTHTAIKNE